MDRLHDFGVMAAATVAARGVRLSSSPAFGPSAWFGSFGSFGNRVWWYDVHQVEGAV